MTLGQNSAGKDLKARYLWLGLVMIAGLMLLAGRLYRLQIAHGDEYSAKSFANFVKEIRVKADRGIIKDRRGEILVDSRPSFDVFITPAFCERCSEEVLPRLAGWLAWDEDQRTHVEQLLRAAKRVAPFQPVPVQLDLNRDELDTLNAHKLELPGVDWPAVPHRNYRTGIVLPHVVGYMNEITQDELERLNAQAEGYALGDFIGRRGVERFFERRLRGKDGSRKEVVNARGETIQELSDLITGEATVASTPGDNVVLSIDMRLQAAAEKAFPGTAGAVVAMDVRTGFILAMVSRPGFDPNVLTGRVTPAQLAALNKDPLQPMIFRPAQQHYSPGSTFKTLSMFAALGEQELQPSQHGELWRRVPARRADVALSQGRRSRAGGRAARAAAVVRHLVLQGGRHPGAGSDRGHRPELRLRRAHRDRRGGRGAGHHAGQRLPRPGHTGRVHQGPGSEQRHRAGRRQRDAAAADHGLRRGRQRRAPLQAAAGAAAGDPGRAACSRSSSRR